MLTDIPPADGLVACHGDSCAPNTLLTGGGRRSGHVDLGALSVADRWADLAVATWSTTWNYGPGWEMPLLRAYGVPADPDRTRHYRLLWDLGPSVPGARADTPCAADQDLGGQHALRSITLSWSLPMASMAEWLTSRCGALISATSYGQRRRPGRACPESNPAWATPSAIPRE